MLVCARWLYLISTEHRILISTRFKASHSAFRHLHSTNIHNIYQRSLVSATCTCKSFLVTNEVPCDSIYAEHLLKHSYVKTLPWYQSHLVKFYCQNAAEPEKKPSLLQRFKQMYKDYWYVLVPVHLVTSAFWFTLFYYMTKSGVDIAAALESIGAGEKLVEKLRSSNSTMGYIAISYALYKIATPLRYTVTLGGTTLSIKYLRDWGYIKPIPPKDKIKEIIHEKRENLKSRYKEKGFIERILLKTGLKKNREDKD